MFKGISLKLSFLMALPFAIAAIWYPIIIKISVAFLITYFCLYLVSLYLEAYLAKIEDPEYIHPHEKIGWIILEVLYLVAKGTLYILGIGAVVITTIILSDSYKDGLVPQWVTLSILFSAFLLIARDGYKMLDRIEQRNKRLGL